LPRPSATRRGADESAFLPNGRRRCRARLSWIAEAWGLFKEALIWIVASCVVFILIAIELVPLIGGIAGLLLAPVLALAS
jgi:hypothetical protein